MSASGHITSDESDDQEDARLLVRTRPTMADLEYNKQYTVTVNVPSPASSSHSSGDVMDTTQQPTHHLITHDNMNASIMICELFTAQCACLWFGILILCFGVFTILQYQCIIPFRPYAAYAITEMFILPISLCLIIVTYSHFHKLRYAISTSNLYALPLLLWLLLFVIIPIFGWFLFAGMLTPNRKNMTMITPVTAIAATPTQAPVTLTTKSPVLMESGVEMFIPDPRNAPCRNLDTDVTMLLAYITNVIHSICLFMFLIGCCHPKWNSSESIYASYSYHGEDTIEAKRRVYQEARNTPRKPPTEPSWFARYKKATPSPESPPPPVSKSLARTTSIGGDFMGAANVHPRQSSQIDPEQIAKIREQQQQDEQKSMTRAQRREQRKKRKESMTSQKSRDSITSIASLDSVIATLQEPVPVPNVLITVSEGEQHDEQTPGAPPKVEEDIPRSVSATSVEIPRSISAISALDEDIPRSISSYGDNLAPPNMARSLSASSTTSTASYTVPLAIAVIPPTPEQQAEASERPVSPAPEV